MAIIFTPVNKTWAIVNNRISLSDIPADWQLKGTLLRNCGCIEPERFSFYLLPNGQGGGGDSKTRGAGPPHQNCLTGKWLR